MDMREVRVARGAVAGRGHVSCNGHET
jgi:hypothetical protein